MKILKFLFSTALLPISILAVNYGFRHANADEQWPGPIKPLIELTVIRSSYSRQSEPKDMKPPKQPMLIEDNRGRPDSWWSDPMWLTAIATIFTAAAAFSSVWAARRLGQIAEDQHRVSQSQLVLQRNAERAYVNPGGDFRAKLKWRNNEIDRSYKRFRGDLGNYGRTPAFVTYITSKVGVYELEGDTLKIPRNPDFKTELIFNGLPIFPNSSTDDLPWSRVHLWREKIEPNQFVYGRVWYIDIFNQRHSDGFIYTVGSVGETRAVANPPPEYISSDPAHLLGDEYFPAGYRAW